MAPWVILAGSNIECLASRALMALTPRQTQTLLWSGIAVILAIALLTLGPVLTPFVTAAILAYVLEPGVRWLASHKVPRSIATLMTLTTTLLVLLLVLLILIPIVQQEITLIRERLPALISTITERFLPWIRERFGLEMRLDVSTIRTWLTENFRDLGDDIAAKIFAYARTGWGAAIQILSLVFLVPIVSFFLLMDWDHLLEQLRNMIPPRWMSKSQDLLSEVDTLLGQYLRGQLQVMLAMAVFYSAGLAIAGFDLWLPIGILSGLLMAIPYLGFALGMTFAMIDGMLQLGPLYGAISVGIVYGLGQVIESYFLTPRLVGEKIGLHPVAVIFALLAFGAVFGFVGVLLALPLAAIIAVALRRIRDAYRESEFFNRST